MRLNLALRNFIKYQSLIQELVKRDLKVKYRRSVLGYLWSLLNPLIMMLVITAVFSVAFKQDIPNFPMYLLSGQILFSFFSEATTTAMSSIVSSGALLKKVYMPKYIFPLSRTLSSFVNLLFSLLAVIIMLLVTRVPITPTVLLFPIPLIYVLLFAIGIGLALSVCMVYFRDTAHLYSVFLTAWMYFTPIFYPEKIVPDMFRDLMKYNPLYHFIQYFRQVVVYGQLPSLKENMICIGVCILVLVVGMLFFRKNQDKFILYI